MSDKRILEILEYPGMYETLFNLQIAIRDRNSRIKREQSQLLNGNLDLLTMDVPRVSIKVKKS
jgi:hypothetical protein